MKRFLTLLTVLVLVVFVGSVVFVILRPQSPLPPKIIHPTPQQAARAEQHLDTLREQLLHPPTASQGIVTLRLSEDDLNVYLASSRTARSLLKAQGVQAVQVNLNEPNHVQIRASILYHHQPANVQVEGTMTSDRTSGLHFQATGAQVGQWPIPAGILTEQADKITSRFGQEIQSRAKFQIQSIQVHGKTLVMTEIPIRSQ